LDERGKTSVSKNEKQVRPITILRNVVAVLITIGLIAYLIYRLNPQEISSAIKNLEIWALSLSILNMLVMFCLKVLRWQFILKRTNVQLNFLSTLKLILIGNFGAAVTPAKIGDVVRAYYLSKWYKTKETTSYFSAILDRVMDLLSISVLAIIFLPFFLPRLDPLIKWAIVGGLIIVAIVILLAFNSQIVRNIIKLVVKLRNRINTDRGKESSTTEDSKVVKTIDAYYSNLNLFKKRSFLVIFFISFLFWILLGLQVSLLAVSMAGVDINIITILTITGIMAVAAIASLIPISVSGIGIRDATITFLMFISLGISYEVAFGASILQTTLNMLIPALVGGLILLISRWRKKRIKENSMN
jgi:uncharacterized protein (TIRG00374 family)